MSEQNSQAVEMEVMSAVGTVEQVSRAEIDVQIATAHRFPRTISKVKADMLSFATLDQDTAAGCFYSLPRGGKNIQGPSVRLAEIAVSCYGNIRAGSRILETVTTGDTPHVVVQAVAHDLEKNVSVSIEKRRRIIGKKDWKTQERKPIDEDDINLATNACTAIAFRDAVFKTVPLALVKPVMEAAKKVAIGDAKTLVDRRAKAMEAFAKMGVQKDRVFGTLGVRALEDITLDHLETLLGLHTAIRDGTISVDEAFPVTPPTIAKPVFQQPQASSASAVTSFLTEPEATVPEVSHSSELPVEAAQSPAEPPKRIGRPPGSRNKTKETPTAAGPAEQQNATNTAAETRPSPAQSGAAAVSPQEKLAEIVLAAGFGFDQFHRYARAERWLLEDKDSFADLPEQMCRTILKFGDALIPDMRRVLEGGSNE